MHSHGKGIKGLLMMVLCVAGPITALILLSLSRSGVISLPGWLPYVLFLLCPLSHILMLPLMNKHRNASDSDSNSSSCH